MASITDIQGRGRGLVAQRPISAGEVVLTDQPVLLLTNYTQDTRYCSSCLQSVQQGQEVTKVLKRMPQMSYTDCSAGCKVTRRV